MTILNLIVIILIILLLVFSAVKQRNKINYLGKGTEEYTKKKKSFLKLYLTIVLLYIVQITILCVVFSNKCICGYYWYNPTPISIFMLVQLIVNIVFFRKNENSEISLKLILIYFVVLILLFLGILFLFQNDMDKLHSFDLISY